MRYISPKGKKLIQDIRGIANTARLMIQEKNADELLQSFVWHTQNGNTDTLKLGDAIPVQASEARADVNSGVLITGFFFYSSN